MGTGISVGIGLAPILVGVGVRVGVGVGVGVLEGFGFLIETPFTSGTSSFFWNKRVFRIRSKIMSKKMNNTPIPILNFLGSFENRSINFFILTERN